MDHHAEVSPGKTALVFDGTSYTYQSIRSSVRAAAGILYGRLDGGRQQVIALMAPNGWDFIVWYLAILELGHIAMPIDSDYKRLEVEAITRQVKPVLILATTEHRHNFNGTDVLVCDGTDLSRESNFERLRLPPDEQIATLLFTSGTTGKPKIAPYTHANHIWNIEVSSPRWNWTADDRMLLTLPLSHWYGLVMGLSGVLFHGNTLYLHEYPDTVRTLEALGSGDITFFTHVAGMYAKLANREAGKDYDLSAVRICISGGAPLPPQIWQKFQDRYGIGIIEAYGSTETGRIASNSAEEKIIGSPGRLLPGVEASLSAEAELLIKSPGMFPGYYNNPELTASKYIDGWWKTGDIAELNGDVVTLKSRTQERINRGGYTLYPRDIEWAVLQMPGLKEAYALGVLPADGGDEQLVIYATGTADEEKLRNYCRHNLPRSWQPDRLVLMDELPKTRSGKPEINKLKALAGI